MWEGVRKATGKVELEKPDVTWMIGVRFVRCRGHSCKGTEPVAATRTFDRMLEEADRVTVLAAVSTTQSNAGF